LVPGSPADFVLVEGNLGKPAARVAAMYSNGYPVDLRPVEWPG